MSKKRDDKNVKPVDAEELPPSIMRDVGRALGRAAGEEISLNEPAQDTTDPDAPSLYAGARALAKRFGAASGATTDGAGNIGTRTQYVAGDETMIEKMRRTAQGVIAWQNSLPKASEIHDRQPATSLGGYKRKGSIFGESVENSADAPPLPDIDQLAADMRKESDNWLEKIKSTPSDPTKRQR